MLDHVQEGMKLLRLALLAGDLKKIVVTDLCQGLSRTPQACV